MFTYETIADVLNKGGNTDEIIHNLREVGVDIKEKVVEKPLTGLLGRWVRDKDGVDLLVIDNSVDGESCIRVVKSDISQSSETTITKRAIFDLTFPEEIISPEDVPVGSLWIVGAHYGEFHSDPVPAQKTSEDQWEVLESVAGQEYVRDNEHISLISPLVPAQVGEGYPKTVKTEEEYKKLPEGSIVAALGSIPWQKMEDDSWESIAAEYSWGSSRLAEVTRSVLRYGYGDE